MVYMALHFIFIRQEAGEPLAARTVPAAAHQGHHRARHTLPRDSDYAITPAFRRLRPPGALQAAAPGAPPCTPPAGPLPRLGRRLC